MKNLKYEEILKYIQENDSEKCASKLQGQDISEAIRKYYDGILDSSEKIKTVVGLDIFKYSKKDRIGQLLAVCMLRMLIDKTINHCNISEKTFFQNYQFEGNNINTGDGYYIIFDNPLQGIIFISFLFVFLRDFNSYCMHPKIRCLLGYFELRSAITYGDILKMDGNYYGNGIISNARIMSKDHLNRFLMDGNTYQWLIKNIGGIENLQTITSDELLKLLEIGYSATLGKPCSTLFFDGKFFNNKLEEAHIQKEALEELQKRLNMIRRYGIINCDVQKVGSITVKSDPLEVYNIHMQVCVNMGNEKETRPITTTIGNLNIEGISDDN